MKQKSADDRPGLIEQLTPAQAKRFLEGMAELPAKWARDMFRPPSPVWEWMTAGEKKREAMRKQHESQRGGSDGGQE